jgi:hypothetical protein
MVAPVRRRPHTVAGAVRSLSFPAGETVPCPPSWASTALYRSLPAVASGYIDGMTVSVPKPADNKPPT